MSENMIAICLYIGIFLMAGTMLGLTVIYFVKSASTRTGSSGISDVKQTNEKKPDKIRVKKTKSIKAVMSAIKMKKPKKTKKEALPTVEDNKTDNKEVTATKQFVEVRPEDNDKTPKMVPAVPAVNREKELKTNIVPQPSNQKSENPKQQLLKETPKAEVIVSPPSPPKPTLEIIKPMLEGNSHSSNANGKTVVVEAVKKELAPKMDSKNVNTPPQSPVENPQTIAVKPAAPVANATVYKKVTEQKASLSELSKMFSKEVVEDSEATKLAKNMKDVEINNLVKDGQDLINLLKRGRS